MQLNLSTPDSFRSIMVTVYRSLRVVLSGSEDQKADY